MAKIISLILLLIFCACSTSVVDTNRKKEEQEGADKEDAFIHTLSMTQIIDATSSCTVGDLSDIQKKNRSLTNAKDKALTSLELGLCYRYLNDYSKSLFYFDLGLGFSDRKNAKLRSAILFNIGEIYFKAKSYFYARDFFQKSLDEYPQNEHAKWGMILLNIENGFYAQANTYLGPLLKNYPTSRVLLSVKGIVLFLTNDFGQLEGNYLNQFNESEKEFSFLQACLNSNRSAAFEEISKMKKLPFILERLKPVVLEKLADEDKNGKI